jgi:hypothetical protein
MGPIQLTERDKLIVRILHMPDDQIAALAEFVEDLEIHVGDRVRVDEEVGMIVDSPDDPNWGDEGISAVELERRNRIDQAAVDAVRGEPTEPLEDALRELGID